MFRKKLINADHLILKLFKNAGTLLVGNLGAAILGFISLAMTARALGAASFGTLVLITSYILIVDKLINFQSWQALIKYGSEALECGDKEDFKSIIKFGFILDAGVALLGVLVAAVGAKFFGGWQNWTPENITMVIFYSVTIFFHIAGAPIAILRMFDKFQLLSAITFSVAVIKFAAIMFAIWIGAGLRGFLLVWGGADIIGNLLLLIFSWRELVKLGYFRPHCASLTGINSRFPGMLGVFFRTNFISTIRMVSRELDLLIVGAILSPSAVGLYKVAKQVANVLAVITDPLYHAIYPVLAKLHAKGENRSILNLVRRSIITVGFFSLIMFVILTMTAKILLINVFGYEFIEARNVMIFYSFAVCMAVASFPITPLMIAKGDDSASMKILIIATAIHFFSALFFINKFGLVGAGIAYLLFYISWISISVTYIRSKAYFNEIIE